MIKSGDKYYSNTEGLVEIRSVIQIKDVCMITYVREDSTRNSIPIKYFNQKFRLIKAA